MLNADVVATS